MNVVLRWLPVVAWSAVILIASDDAFSAANSGAWFRGLFGRDLPHVLHVAIRKLAHVVEYGILGALAFRAARIDFPRRAMAIALAVALLVSMIDEVHQSTIASRTGTGWDVLLDLIGAGIALWFLRRNQQSA
ncbi:MAG TPA: VanZ family protein [Thermoanaerobaculia bacterium]|nr:VanZ family protein [Thermoanaerobaculia bacterium]